MTELAVRDVLVQAEAARLAQLEETIEQGLAHVGQALAEIRDEKLWRESHDTFQDYCLDRWSMSHRHANRKIQAAAVLSELGPIGPVPIESQARELVPLLDEPEQLRDAWQEANANGTATAATVREAVAVRRPLDPDIMERHQRDTAVEVLDRSVYALEANIGDIPIHLDWILETRDLAGPYGVLTAERLRKASDYCAAFAAELKKRGI